MDYRFHVWMLFFGLAVVSIQAEPSKRLLLHTEGDIVTRIAELEKHIADQNTKIADQNTKIADQSRNIADQNTKIADQSKLIADQSKNITAQNTKIADQNTKIADQNTKIADQNTKIADQNTEITALKTQLQTMITNEKTGDTYVRWGRTTCPGNGSTLVHAGYMSGAFMANRTYGGAGANYVCLPDNPTWDYFNSSKDNNISVTGVEYNFYPHHLTASQQLFFGNFVGRSEAPCALCYVSRGTSVMIPGRTDCYSGWTKEYSGYLVGGYPRYADSTEYVCLDRRPQAVPHSGDADVENTLFFVEAHCGGTLACPPYVDGREIACVVCSI